MTSPRTTRRHAIIAIVVVCTLVLGGLAWATHSAIRLERVQARKAREDALDEARAIALSKLDTLVAPVLDREQGRPFEHYRPFFKPAQAFSGGDGPEVSGSILLESPLHNFSGPDWILLHFQATETYERESWISPQTDEGFQSATPASVIPAVDRRRLAKAENWLAALRERYTPLELLQRLEQVVTADGDAPPRAVSGTSAVLADAPRGIRHRAAEFLRRGARLGQIQSEEQPAVCWPETVAFENLQADIPPPPTTENSPACVTVLPTPMEPVWLDVTMDGSRQLAFMRTVTVDTGDFCTLQGVLLDWPRLQELLQTEVRKLFPKAEILPLATDRPVPHSPTHTVMHTIPAHLETGDPPFTGASGISTGLKVGLSVAWGATVLALMAIGYGTMKYVTYAERRLRFVSAVTHELRTPLTSFQLYADLLADMPQEDAAQRRHHAEALRTESRRLARLVENVLAYSRIGDTAPAVQWAKLPPQELLDAIRTATEKQCRTAGKELVVENHCPRNLRIETDSEFVVQILINLVENACKYSAEAGDPRIWLNASRPTDGNVAFEVDDAGPGVLPHDRRDVFQPFRRARTADAGRPGGMGLGLALSGYWANCLGGGLDLRRSPRNGARYTCFVLSLPVARKT
ncbi:MAG: HAMP domain-containing sensor histidine kinase [Dehalococcoidia bacterium]